jgi:spore coat polysaccharide biosynthesis protein SpsF
MITAIIQARVNSTRLPNKVFAKIEGYPLIWHVINRIKKSKKIDNIIIATSDNILDDVIENWCLENAIQCYRGSESNVLERFYFAASKMKAKIIVRITADDPFKDPEIIDGVIYMLEKENLDFAYNNNPPSFPEGLDIEVFTYGALKFAFESSKDSFEQEHVTQYFYRNKNLFKQKNFSFIKDISHFRWTIDREKDLEMTREIYRHLFKKNNIFLLEEILNLLEEQPWIAEINSEIERSDMYKKEVENGKN